MYFNGFHCLLSGHLELNNFRVFFLFHIFKEFFIMVLFDCLGIIFLLQPSEVMYFINRFPNAELSFNFLAWAPLSCYALFLYYTSWFTLYTFTFEYLHMHVAVLLVYSCSSGQCRLHGILTLCHQQWISSEVTLVQFYLDIWGRAKWEIDLSN